MNTQLVNSLVQGSFSSAKTFPEIVQALVKEGFESYHVDLVRSEYRYYMPNGESHVVTADHQLDQAASDFTAAGVEAAVRASQAGQVNYQEFLKRILKAGCVYYVTYLRGKKVAYFGRDGSEHVEYFPQK